MPVQLSPVDFLRLMDIAERRVMLKGNDLNQEGRPHEEVFLIVEGNAEVCTCSRLRQLCIYCTEMGIVLRRRQVEVDLVLLGLLTRLIDPGHGSRSLCPSLQEHITVLTYRVGSACILSRDLYVLLFGGPDAMPHHQETSSKTAA